MTARSRARDPLEALTRSAYGYVSNDPINRTDPTGMWDIPEWVPVVGGMCVDINDPDCVTPAEGQPNDVGNFASGMLSLNPITGTMDAFGLIDTSQYADACSGWYTAGQATMFALDLYLAGATMNAATTELSYNMYLFGPRRQGVAIGRGLLNQNDWLRIGWSWSQPAGRVVFRLSGSLLLDRHIDLL